VHWESIVPRLVEEAGLPRPVIRELAEPASAPVMAEERPRRATHMA
jgi:hypothetical protein